MTQIRRLIRRGTSIISRDRTCVYIYIIMIVIYALGSAPLCSRNSVDQFVDIMSDQERIII